ncbi:aminotransferase class V-fold PLP-dependent enzyme [Fulvivirga lutea]|uniref:phosphoserine transaminase n=1 Tax=Fulvivirga lutea TaxID=2810512 RepID=A0A974WE78_9BACT|nr:aminotransferase class V-fold PLP-dependent enzyme [Fulvivirga lutea]QSE96391.1 aminotransferase class V-fold PLP-dependent enzyme [Fulvivirga lutea]
MKKLYFTPGPSQLYFTVEEHLKNALKEGVPSISHRSKDFQAIYSNTAEQLKELLNIPEGYHIVFTSSATEVWERIGQNLIERESFHFVNGAFSEKFQNVIENLGKSALKKQADEGSVVDVETVLIPESSELISITYNETSTGASHTQNDLSLIRESFEDQLIALDVVSITPSVEIDFSVVDTFYFSVQKCFGLPAGLGVWVFNEKCIQKAESLLNKGISIGSYHCIPELVKKSVVNQTPDTPNMLNIYLLGKVAEDMNKKGVQQIRQETNYKHALLQHTINESKYLSHFVEKEINRSKTTAVAITTIDSKLLIDALNKKGLVIGSGYGNFKASQIRIANFPTHSKEQIEMLSDQILSLNI